MNTTVNVARVIDAMRKKQWTIAETCANCGVTSKTLRTVLDGALPKRIDALYRILDGLELTTEEAVIVNAGAHRKKGTLLLLEGRRSPSVA